MLSCGGAIHRQVAAGEAVQVITLFTGEAASHGDAGPLSPFARLQHHYWGDRPRPCPAPGRGRGGADFVGRRLVHLDYLDAIYRAGAERPVALHRPGDAVWRGAADDPMVSAEDGPGHAGARLYPPCDPIRWSMLRWPSAATWITRSSIAAARRLVSRGYRVAFYEDYPYAGQPGALEAALAAAGAEDWQPEVIPWTQATWRPRLRPWATTAPDGTLFRGAEAMIGQVWAFAASRAPEVGLAERIWWPPEA